jgi:hypothetical protein
MPQEQEKRVTVRGHSVSYSEDASEAIHYLTYDVTFDKAQEIFDEARSKGFIKFKDRMLRKFKLACVEGVYYKLTRI